MMLSSQVAFGHGSLSQQQGGSYDTTELDGSTTGSLT